MNRLVQQLREATWPRTAQETVAKLRDELRNAKRIKSRGSVLESERLKAWHERENLTHRFANGVQVEIKLNQTKP